MRLLARFIPLLILFLAAYWRFYHIDTQSLWHDEGNSLRLAERSVSDLIEATSHDIHPPGYYLALKGWIGLMGKTEFGLRSLSAFWGVIGVAATFALGRRFFGFWAATLAALLVAANPFAVYYGQEARMYAQLGALSILSLWLLVRLLDEILIESGHKPHWQKRALALALIIVNILGLYTHYTYPFTMLVQGIYFAGWWLYCRKSSDLIMYIALNLLIVIGFSPWLPTAYDQVTTWPTTGDATSTLDRLERVFTILIYGHTLNELSPLAYLIPIILILAAFFPVKDRTKTLLATVPLLLILISIASLLLSGAYREANLKFLLPAQSATALLLGYGASRLFGLFNLSAMFGTRREGASRPLITAIPAAIALILIGSIAFRLITELDRLYTDPAFARSDYRAIAKTVSINARPGDAIILTAPNQQEVFSYYYNGSAPVFPLPRGLGGDDPATQIATQNLINQYQRIYVVLWGQQERDPNRIVEHTLSQGAFEIGRQWYQDVELVQYAVLAPPPAEPIQISAMPFGGHITLRGFALSGDTFQAGEGDVLGVTLYWQTDAPLESRYKISVQMLDTFGRLACQDGCQHDSEPANGQSPTITWQPGQTIVDNHGLALRRDLPAGDYTLIVVVYDSNAPSVRLQPANDDPNAIYTLAHLTLK